MPFTDAICYKEKAESIPTIQAISGFQILLVLPGNSLLIIIWFPFGYDLISVSCFLGATPGSSGVTAINKRTYSHLLNSRYSLEIEYRFLESLWYIILNSFDSFPLVYYLFGKVLWLVKRRNEVTIHENQVITFRILLPLVAQLSLYSLNGF